MKGSRITKFGMAAAGLMLLGWLVLSLVLSAESTKSKPAVTDDKHCPVCGLELPRYAIGGECPYCKLEGNADGQKKKQASQSPLASPVIPTVLCGTLCTLLVIHLVLITRSRLRKEEVCCHMHCPKCGRRLRYRRSQIGRPGRCPLCARPLLFPKPAQEAAGRWGKIRQLILHR